LIAFFDRREESAANSEGQVGARSHRRRAGLGKTLDIKPLCYDSVEERVGQVVRFLQRDSLD
jgi:hypothetical protein